MIKHKILLDNAPSVVGQQIHINHIDCEAGVDTKRRLYIKREATAIVAYCHHCNQKGFVKHGDDRLSTWINKPAAAATSNNKPVIASLTTEGKVWLHSHYCDTTNSSFNGIAGERHKVALTLHDTDNQPIGWQIRNLALNATPKYTTHYTNSSSKGDAAWFKGNNTLVITEDYLSAWRVNYDTGYTSVALLRTALSDKTLRQIHDLNFEYVVIWLDPDEAGVQGATKAYKKLNHFLPSTTKIIVLGIDKEPKQCTPAELESILI